MDAGLYERNTLSLFLVEFVLFGVAAVLATHQAVHAYRRYRQHGALLCTGSRARPLFLALVATSLLTRLLFLCVAFFYSASGGVGVWLRVLCRCFPALVYFSAYSVIVAFWADTYFSSRLVAMPVMVLSAIFYVNVALYSIFVCVAVVTLLHESYFQFRRVAMFLVGVGSVAVAVFWLLFGVRVQKQLGQAVSGGRSRSISVRMTLLCLICPTLFVLQGVYNIMVALDVIHRYYPLSGAMRAWWDAVVFLTCEWVPCMVIIFVFWSRGGRRQALPSPPRLIQHLHDQGTHRFELGR